LATINPIITSNFENYSNENDNFPKEMLEILKKLMEIESTDSIRKESIDRLYEQVLTQYAENKDVVKWCKEYIDDK